MYGVRESGGSGLEFDPTVGQTFCYCRGRTEFVQSSGGTATVPSGLA